RVAAQSQHRDRRSRPPPRGRISPPGIFQQMKKLAIIGYGKMGRLIEQLAPEYDFSLHSKLDLNDDLNQAAGAHVAIELTNPHAVAGNVEKISALNIPLVVGTTGWAAEMPRILETIHQHDGALVWSPNFSIGVNVFTRLVHEAAKLLANEQ